MLIFDARWTLGENGTFFLNGSVAQTEAGFGTLFVVADPNTPQWVFDTYFPNGLPGPGDDPGSQLRFADYDFTEVNEYSDLELTELRATAGVEYKATDAAMLFASVSYFDLDDDQPFIQDATGTVTVISGGVTWTF